MFLVQFFDKIDDIEYFNFFFFFEEINFIMQFLLNSYKLAQHPKRYFISLNSWKCSQPRVRSQFVSKYRVFLVVFFSHMRSLL